MNAGRTLSQLAAELERQSISRKDYIAPQGKIEAVVVAEADGHLDVQIDGINSTQHPITNYAHAQLATHLEIPKTYYDRMRAERPTLLAENVNTWLHADPDNKRMIRAIDGRIRAIMSPKYRPLDNFDLAQTILPVLIDNKVEIVSCELTETRMFVKGILPTLSDELPDGMAYGGHNRIGTDRGHLVAAITISNSDVGDGTLRVEPSVFTTWCTNLAIMAQAAMKKYHVGRAGSADDASYEVFTDATRAADDKAFWLKVKDVTMSAFREDLFRAAIASIKVAGGRPITSDDLPAVVDSIIEVLALPVARNTGILKLLAAGGDLTQWGLSSAITRLANDTADYEGATELERAGGKVLALAPREWQRVSTAVEAVR